MLRAPAGGVPSRASRCPARRSVVAAILAVVSVIALSGSAGAKPSTTSPPAFGHAQLGIHLATDGIDGVVGVSGLKAATPTHGQRSTTGTSAALLPLALSVVLLLTLAASAASTGSLALRRLPSRRAPPQHAFSR